MRFSPDDRVFVAKKVGRILVFEDLEDPIPTVFAELRTHTYDANDRGLLSIALDPGFPAQPYVYALYTYDHVLGGEDPAPEWGDPGRLATIARGRGAPTSTTARSAAAWCG